MTPEYELVHPVRIRARCDCGGEYKPTGQVNMTAPVQYEHKCDRCGARMRTQTQFPAIEHFTEAELRALTGQ